MTWKFKIPGSCWFYAITITNCQIQVMYNCSLFYKDPFSRQQKKYQHVLFLCFRRHAEESLKIIIEEKKRRMGNKSSVSSSKSVTSPTVSLQIILFMLMRCVLLLYSKFDEGPVIKTAAVFESLCSDQLKGFVYMYVSSLFNFSALRPG